MGQSRPFFVYFRSFQANITIFTANICEKCPPSIRCRDSNPWTTEHESLPITTRPGLPPGICSVNQLPISCTLHVDNFNSGVLNYFFYNIRSRRHVWSMPLDSVLVLPWQLRPKRSWSPPASESPMRPPHPCLKHLFYSGKRQLVWLKYDLSNLLSNVLGQWPKINF